MRYHEYCSYIQYLAAIVFARVHRSRHMGAMTDGVPPPIESWSSGIFEFSDWNADTNTKGARRLVLRQAMAAPGLGTIHELFEPRLIGVMDHRTPPYLILRGIEPVELGSGKVGAVVQEWLVALLL